MKILIYGANGWIGRQFIDVLNKNNIEYIIGYSRVNHIENLESLLSFTKNFSNVILF